MIPFFNLKNHNYYLFSYLIAIDSIKKIDIKEHLSYLDNDDFKNKYIH